MQSADELLNEQLRLSAHAAVRGWLISFASRIVGIAPQQNCGRSGCRKSGSDKDESRSARYGWGIGR
jgi:hypothetical protein